VKAYLCKELSNIIYVYGQHAANLLMATQAKSSNDEQTRWSPHRYLGSRGSKMYVEQMMSDDCLNGNHLSDDTGFKDT
jgi:hypothetical protein